LYAGASVVAYPSLAEGFGLPVLEAMAYGVPVVTSAGTATEEVAGDAALLVDPLDTDAIAGAIERILEDGELAASLGAAARVRASLFSWERSAELVAAVYAEAAGTRR
jgi:glycosyltransferase involved in cell wall biosynthesis